MKITTLLQTGEQLFSIQDIALLWNESNRHNLRMTTMRLVKAGKLFRIYRGLYSLLPIEKLDPLKLGTKIMQGYGYLSLQSILIQHGILSQGQHAYTFVAKTSKDTTIGPWRFSFHTIHDKYRFQPFGVEKKNNTLTANPNRAIADLLYLDSHAHFDAPINWKNIHDLQQNIGYPLTQHRYDFATT